LNRTAFDEFRKLAYEKAGIALNGAKEPLVAARVGRRVRALGLNDELDYMEYLVADETGDELVLFLDAISTNFTSFFREPEHFDELASFVRAHLEKHQRRFRFWSAACSTGEEPYSMAMALSQVFEGSSVDWRILATDISTQVLAHAEAGVYGAEQLKTVPPGLRATSFTRAPGTGKASAFQVNEELQRRISFRRFNLAAPPFPMPGPLDAVLCRNVMIYFDNRVRQGLISEIERLLRPGGLLLIGHTETLSGLETELTLLRPSVYQKRESAQ
jgi:chemotaxis protein methyltransferase CheR